VSGPATTDPGGTQVSESSTPGAAAPETTAPQYSTGPVALRRPDILAGLLLVLAGVAAALSLVAPWVKGSTATGLALVRQGFSSPGHLVSTGLWQPLAIVLGGGVLFLIGLLVLLPARAHRFLGLVALLVTVVVAAGLLVPLAAATWRFDAFDTGFWLALAVGGLGLLGSLKALLTRPRTAPV
jgi:hypothetical protein